MRCLAFVAAAFVVSALVGCQDDAQPKEAAKEAQPQPKPQETPPVAQTLPAGIWDAPIKTLDGKATTLAEYKGKVLLIAPGQA